MPRPAEPSTSAGMPVGISSCLLGRPVRHDGSHRRNPFLIDMLGEHFDYVAVCPEVEVGMGVPRPSLRLVRIDGAEEPRLVATRSGQDWSDAMRAWAAERVERLARQGLRGFVLKSRSPSCGMARVKVYSTAGQPVDHGPGLFAATLAERLPLLPIEEDGRLNDARLRENFVLRVFVYDEWLRLRAEADPARLVRFHTRHKVLLMAQDPARTRALGRLVARAGAADGLDALLDEYGALMMTALARPASPRRHVNAMQHLSGVVKGRLDPDEKRELAGLIDEYRAGRVPVEVPLTLLRHHLRRSGHAWALEQSYLDPYPRNLGLRSRV